MLDFDPQLEPVMKSVSDALKQVERAFNDQLASDLPPVTQLVKHIERYRGKMLRPTLVILCGMAANQRPTATAADLTQIITSRHIASAAVCEMVHMATLVHDDVLDEADTRRRGDTVNRLHGNETAVILGDLLIASAYELCSRDAGLESSLLVARASTITCAGELLQLHHRGDFSLDEPTYFEIVARKTAELIATACELGALHSGASPEARSALAEFGREVGVAFQIQDDLLDLTGSVRTVGKSVGKDLEKGKMTLPLVLHLASCSPSQRGQTLRLLERACGDFPPGDTDAAAAARELAETLAASGAIDRSRRHAVRLIEQARQRLAPIADSGAKAALLAMADAVVDRAF